MSTADTNVVISFVVVWVVSGVIGSLSCRPTKMTIERDIDAEIERLLGKVRPDNLCLAAPT